MTKSSIKKLREVRKRLRRSMTQMDKHGFIFNSVFGAERKDVFSTPHVSVTVELRSLLNSKQAFQVSVFYNIFTATDDPTVETYHDAVKAATRKARWASKLIHGLSWTNEQVLKS